MRIQTLSNHNVRLSYYQLINDEVEFIERDFFVRSGVYVMEWNLDGSDTSQVCEELEHGGSTLMCRDSSLLAEKIRREFRRMERSNRADEWEKNKILSNRDPRVKAYLSRVDAE